MCWGEYLNVSGTFDISVVRLVIVLGNCVLREYLNVSGTIDSSVLRMVIVLGNCVLGRIYGCEWNS